LFPSLVVAGATTQAEGTQLVRRFKLRLKNRLVQFNDQNFGDVRDIISPGLYIYWFTDVITAPIMTQEIVVRFKDS